MGMAAYGDPYRYDLSDLLCFDKGSGSVFCDKRLRDKIAHTSVFETHADLEFIASYVGISPVFTSCPSRSREHFDLAASVQLTFKRVYMDLIDYYVKLTGITDICLSGGCALNCLANMSLHLDRPYQVYVQPAASDRGLSIGSAFEVSKMLGSTPQPVQDLYLGPTYSDTEIAQSLKISGLLYETVEDIDLYAARAITEGLIIGWFQGRSEFGPRALGARSILASPRIRNNCDLINSKIKFREKFRPFAPAILASDLAYLSSSSVDSPFMTTTIPIDGPMSSHICECIHTDGTARVQTVSRPDNPLYGVLTHLRTITGIGACINTSFNLAGEPIVEKPTDALRTFVSSGLDLLCIGNYVVRKYY